MNYKMILKIGRAGHLWYWQLLESTKTGLEPWCTSVGRYTTPGIAYNNFTSRLFDIDEPCPEIGKQGKTFICTTLDAEITAWVQST